MSTQNSAQWFNPTSDRLEAGGSGIIPSRLSSAQRLALSLTTADAGLTNYDVDAKCVWQWNGSAWVDPVNQRIDVRAYGAKGDASNNDTAAVVLAIAAAAASRQIVYFPPGYTFLLNSRTGPGTSDLISVPSGVRFQIDGTLTGSTGQTVSFVAVGDFQAFGTGFINIGQGNDNRFFQISKGFVRFSGLRFSGFTTTSTPACIVCIDPGSGTLDNLIIENCHAEAYVQYLYLRQQSSGSTHSITRTRISDCSARGIWNGSAILINAVSGLDRDIEISDTLIDTVSGDGSGQAFSGFGIAVAGSGTLPYAITSAVTRVMIHGALINSVREGVHIEYCARVALEDITVTDVNATYYPQGTASGGVNVYGSYDPTLKNVVVTDVTGDGIYAWGIRVSGGYAGAVYAQSNKNIDVSNCRLRNASYIIEQQVLSSAYSGQPAFELTSNSVLHFTGNTTDSGVAQINAVGTINVRDNTLVSPLAISPLSVVSYARNANVATLTLTLQNGNTGILVGDVVKISGVGSGFDTQFATITAVTVGVPISTQFQITFANTGANVGTTACSGSAYNMVYALLINCSDTYVNSNTAFTSVNRLSLTVENNRAANTYGASSFVLRNVSTATRIAANVQLHVTNNNFGLSTSYWPVTPINRNAYTAAGTQPTGYEFVLGDQFSINIGGGGTHTNYICNSGGYVAVAGDTYAIVSAVAGTVSRNGATSWLGTTPAYVYGQLVKLTNGANSIIGMVQKLSGTVGAAGTEIMTLVDPALGTTLDLTSLGGNGTIAPNSVATFVTF